MGRLVRSGLSAAIALLAAIETLATVMGRTIRDLLPDSPWWVHLAAIAVLFAVLFSLSCGAIWLRHRWSASMKVGGNMVRVTCGDLFKCEGWKVIPCDDRFSTQADNVVIAKRSVHGQFLLNCVRDMGELERFVSEPGPSAVGSPRVAEDGSLVFAPGQVKVYGEEYLLLSFSHLNELHEAHITMSEYELCLMNMWRELSRVYAERPISLPLMGSGILRFDGIPKPSDDRLLGCMLCTLRATGLHFAAPITIVIPRKTLSGMHLYEVKGMMEA